MPGIIGTGLLGQALVSRMLAADLAVVGWDIDPIRLQELAGNATLLYYMSEEAQEGNRAFKEKRSPDFAKFGRCP